MLHKITVTILLVILFIFPSSAKGAVTPAHLEGTLVNDRGTIYLIADGKRLGFRDAQEFFSYGYNFDMVVPANESDLLLPQGETLKARAGTLALDSRDNQSLYFVYDLGIRKIETDTLALLGVENYPRYKINLSDYSVKEPLDLLATFRRGESGTLLRDGKTVYLLASSGLLPFPSAEVYFSHGYKFGMARNMNQEEFKLPILAPLSYRNGTLINDRGTIYLISGEKKYGFQTLVGFESRGYKLKAALTGDTNGYATGENFD